MGVELPDRMVPWPDRPGAATPHLDNEVIPAPQLQVVHSAIGVSGTPGALSARLLGVRADHVCSLRCWIAAAQAEGLGVAGVQAGASVRSKR